MTNLICQGCDKLFSGRGDAKTCSPKCRKRLQRTNIAMLPEAGFISISSPTTETNHFTEAKEDVPVVITNSTPSEDSKPPKRRLRYVFAALLILFLCGLGVTYGLKNDTNTELLKNQQQVKSSVKELKTELNEFSDALELRVLDIEEVLDSMSVVVGSDGATGPAGADGTDGAPGANGAVGATGATGATGPAGVATCPNGNCLSLQAGTPGTAEAGNTNITGTAIAALFSGSGASLTSLNASNISSGSLADARLSSNVTLQGNTFNGASQLVQLTGGGILPALNGSNLTNLTGANVTGNISGNAGTATALAANPSDCGANTYATTIAASGNLTCAAITDASLSSNVTLQGNTFNGASQLVQLTAGGLLPVLDGSNLTNLTGANVTGNISGNAATATALASNPTDCGANNYAITIAASGNLTCASISDASLSANVTLQGNTFNGASQLVQLTGGGLLPALDGSNLTTLNATNLSSGTVATGRISGSYTGITGTGALNAGSITSGFGAIDVGADTITSGLINGQTISSSANFTGSLTVATTGVFNGASVTVGTASATTGTLVLQNATNAFTTTITAPDTAISSKTITLPNETGTVCTTGSVCTGYQASVSGGSANQQLSNLSGTVAINLALLPGADNTIDLGDSTFSFRTLYSDTSILTPSLDVATAGVLTIGNTTATSVSVCNSAACDTLTLGNNADADTITVGDSLDTFSLGSTAFNVSNTGALSGITTIGLSGAITGATATNTINGLIINSGALTGVTTLNASGLITSVGLTAGAGLIQGTNGLTITGTTSIGATAGNVTGIGNSTGALTLTGSSGSTLVLNGTTISAAELNLLDAHDVALVDTNDAVATAITGTGALNAGSITSGFGTIDIGADNITTTGTVQGTTSVLTTLVDTASATTLNVGTTNATSIALRKSTAVTGSLSFTTTLLEDGNEILASMISAFPSTCPTGWTEYTAARGRYIVGTPSGGTDTATVGTALTNSENRATGQHGHTVTDPGHVHSGTYVAQNAGSVTLGAGFQVGTAGINSNTTGISIGSTSVSGVTTAVGTNAPYIQLKYCQKTAGSDLAEWTPTNEKLAAGMIVSIDKNDSKKILSSKNAYDEAVAGVVSTEPGWTLGLESKDQVQLALTGRVPTLVSTINGEIKAGDPITSSDIPGVGMKATKPGTIIGRAMEDMKVASNGRGSVTVLLNTTHYEPTSWMSTRNLSLLSLLGWGVAGTVFILKRIPRFRHRTN